MQTSHQNITGRYMNSFTSTKTFAITLALFALVLALPAYSQELAKPPSATYTGFAAPLAKDDPKLSETKARAKYNTCPSGYYGGPQKGKVWYTQDPYLWVVTPAFAKRMCMPPEFVHEGLKGAEAVAFRIASNNEEVNCGWGGNDQSCSGELVFRVEIYIDSKIKIPKRHYGRYYQVASMPSSMLVSATETELKKLRDLNKNHPPDALTAIFQTSQVGLAGFRDGKVAWPLLALYAQTYYGQLFEGIDYYKFEGSAIRTFNNARMKDLGITDFRIKIRPLDPVLKGQSSMDESESEYAHMIHLPPEFSKKMAELDIAQGRNIRALIDQVLKK